MSNIKYQMFLKIKIFICSVFVFSNLFSQNTILWSVQHSEQNTTSYICGTFHQVGNSFIDSLPKVKEMLYSSELAIFESLGTKIEIQKVLNSRKTDSSYLKHLKRKDIQFLNSLSKNWAVPIAKLTPPELLMKLTQTYFEKKCGAVQPTDTWNHFDKYLTHLARSQNISLLGLETDSSQLAIINTKIHSTNEWESLRKPIHTWIKNISKNRHTNKYCQAVKDYMSMSFNYQLNIKCADSIMIERNKDWLEILAKVFPKKNTFVAVGLMHLYGECGLITQLRKKGFVVKPISLEHK